MRSICYSAPNVLEMLDIERPERSAGQVLLAPLFVGICGTDLLIASGGLARVQAGVVLGHEMVCSVIEADDLAVGEIVFVNPLISCGDCDTCNRGFTHVCEYLGLYGIDKNGALADELVVPRANVLPLPEGTDPRSAALIEPLSVAFHMYRRAAESNSGAARVLVIGGGPIGLLVAAVCRLKGHPEVVVVEPNESRRSIAERMGFSPLARIDDKEQFSLVFEATGIAVGLEVAIASAAPRGTVLLGGLAHGPIPFDSAAAVLKELTLVGSRVYTSQDVEEAIFAVAKREVDLKPLVTSVVDLSEALSGALDKLRASKDEMKILIQVGK